MGKLVKVASIAVILMLVSSTGAIAGTGSKGFALKENIAKQSNTSEEYSVYNSFDASESKFNEILEHKKFAQELSNSIENLYNLTDELEDALKEGEAPKDLILKHENAADAVLKSHAKVRHTLNNITILLKERVSEGEIPEEILNRHLKFVEEFESKSSEFLHAIEQYMPTPSITAETRMTTLSTSELEELKNVLEDATRLPESEPVGLAHDPASLTAPKPRILSEKGKIVNTLALDISHEPTDYLDVNASTEIKKLAADLDHDPVQIYYYMRNNIDYEPYFGLMAGSDWTLQQQSGNSFDQANLFVNLIRESEIPARYVYGTIEISAENVTKWLRVKNCTYAVTLLNKSGIPSTYIEENNSIRLEHMWVEAYIEQNSTGRWLPLDPSFKTYEYVPGLNLTFNATEVSAFLNETLENATYDEKLGWVTGINETFINERFEKWANETLEYIMNDSDLRNRTLTQLFGYWNLTKEYSDSLPSILPYEIVSVLDVYSEIPEEYYHKIVLKGLVNYTLYTPDIANKKIMLKFDPATKMDCQTLKMWGWKNLLFPSMVKMKPVLIIDDEEVANGSSRELGSSAKLTLEFYHPVKTTPKILNQTFIVGSLYSLIFNIGKVSLSQIEKEAQELDLAENQSFADNVLGQLHLLGMYWSFETEFFADNYAAAYDVRDYRPAPSYGRTCLNLKVDYFFGIPWSLDEGGMYIDVPRHVLGAIGEENDTRAFMLATGMVASALEHSIFEQLYGTESVSTIKVLQEANRQEIPIYTISKHNIDELRWKLNIPFHVWGWIEGAVNKDRIVIIPERELQIIEWKGIGWMVIDPETGASGFMISGSAGGHNARRIFWKMLGGTWNLLNPRTGMDFIIGHHDEISKLFLGDLIEIGATILPGAVGKYWSSTMNYKRVRSFVKGITSLDTLMGTELDLVKAVEFGDLSALYSLTLTTISLIPGAQPYVLGYKILTSRTIRYYVGGIMQEALKDCPIKESVEQFIKDVNYLADYGIYSNVYQKVGLESGYDVIIFSDYLREIENVSGILNLTSKIATGDREAVFDAEIAAEYRKEAYDIVQLEKKIPGAEVDILIMNPDKTYKIVEVVDIDDWSVFESEAEMDEFKQNISNLIDAFKEEYGEEVEIVFVFDGRVPQWVHDYIDSIPGNVSVVETYGGASGRTLYVGKSYETIQEAIDAASSGDTVYVYSGTYKENVTLDKPLALIGEDSDTTILDGNGSEDIIKVITDDCVISGFTVKNGSTGIYVASDNNLITQNNITNMVGADGDSFITLDKTGGVSTGIYLFRGVNNLISNNSISDITGGVGGTTNDWLCTDGTGGNGMGIYLHFSMNNTLFNNTISNIDGGAGGGDWGHSGIGDGIRLYSSDSNAITNIVANKSDNGMHLEHSSNNNTINNDIFSNNRYGIRLSSSDNNTIAGSNISANKEHGILLKGSNENKIISNEVCFNHKDGIHISGTYDMLTGGYTGGSNQIINNTVYSNQGDGIGLCVSRDNEITNNTINLNNGSGICLLSGEALPFYYTCSKDNRLTQNKINNSGDYGLKIDKYSYRNYISQSSEWRACLLFL